jgi:hypothetical protein
LKIAKQLGVGTSTVQRIVSAHWPLRQSSPTPIVQHHPPPGTPEIASGNRRNPARQNFWLFSFRGSQCSVVNDDIERTHRLKDVLRPKRSSAPVRHVEVDDIGWVRQVMEKNKNGWKPLQWAASYSNMVTRNG